MDNNPGDFPELTGYVRDDGRAGFRNLIPVIPLTGCVQRLALRIAEEEDSAVALWQPFGCDLLGSDQDRLRRMLHQIAASPNVGAVVFATMGCAYLNEARLPDLVKQTGRPVEVVNVQTTGGTSKCVEAGKRAVREFSAELAKQKREIVPLSKIVLGTECGGTEKTSRELCHPALGKVCDFLIDRGATVVLTENYEMARAAEDLAQRAADSEVARKIRDMPVKLFQAIKDRTGYDEYAECPDREAVRDTSLTHISKAGSRPIQKFFEIGDDISGPGLVILDAPNSDAGSLTSLMAGGCNLIAFATGLGNPLVCPLVPTVKLCANRGRFVKMEENLDVLVTEDDLNAPEGLVMKMIEYANGKPTKGEILEHGEMLIPLEGVVL